MIVYHGTTEKFAEDIAKTGLKKREDLAFKLRHPHLIGRPETTEDQTNPEHLPRVTKFADQAISFAVFRTSYEKARLGDTVIWGVPPFSMTKIKEDKRQDPEAEPAIVVFDIPRNWKLTRDEEGTNDDFISVKDIPAQYVQRIVKGKQLQETIEAWKEPFNVITTL